MNSELIHITLFPMSRLALHGCSRDSQAVPCSDRWRTVGVSLSVQRDNHLSACIKLFYPLYGKFLRAPHSLYIRIVDISTFVENVTDLGASMFP